MRYFYHYGYYASKFHTDENWCTSINAIIEVSKESYDAIVEDEKKIMETNPKLRGWNFPFESEDIPEGKHLYFKILFKEAYDKEAKIDV